MNCTRAVWKDRWAETRALAALMSGDRPLGVAQGTPLFAPNTRSTGLRVSPRAPLDPQPVHRRSPTNVLTTTTTT